MIRPAAWRAEPGKEHSVSRQVDRWRRIGAYLKLQMVLLAGLCAPVLIASSAQALEPIDTDGPDFVESSEVVPRGRFQYELDINRERNARVVPATTTTTTPALLKYGFADNFEWRIAPNGYQKSDNGSGWSDTALGLKWHAQDRDVEKGRAAVSWILHADLPSGTSRLRQTGVRPSLRSVITWELPHDLALGLMPGFKYDSSADGHRYGAMIFGAVLNKRINEQLRVFVEYSGRQIARAADGGVIASWDVGAAWLATHDTQIGIRTGIAANRNTPNNYLLFEFAQRF